MRRRDHFDLLARYYDRIIRHYDCQRLIGLVRPLAGGRLLDIGGGTGRAAACLGEHFAQVVVADASQAMLVEARAKSGLQAVACLAEALPFRSGAFGRAIMIDSFHHFKDHRLCLQEAWRVLSGGALLLIEEPDPRTLPGLLLAAFEKLALMRSRLLPADQLEAHLKTLGASVSVLRRRAQMWLVAMKD